MCCRPPLLHGPVPCEVARQKRIDTFVRTYGNVGETDEQLCKRLLLCTHPDKSATMARKWASSSSSSSSSRSGSSGSSGSCRRFSNISPLNSADLDVRAVYEFRRDLQERRKGTGQTKTANVSGGRTEGHTFSQGTSRPAARAADVAPSGDSHRGRFFSAATCSAATTQPSWGTPDDGRRPSARPPVGVYSRRFTQAWVKRRIMSPETALSFLPATDAAMAVASAARRLWGVVSSLCINLAAWGREHVVFRVNREHFGWREESEEQSRDNSFNYYSYRPRKRSETPRRRLRPVVRQ